MQGNEQQRAPVATVTPEELLRFQVLNQRSKAVDAMVQTMVQAAFEAGSKARADIAKEKDELWKLLTEKYQLAADKCYEINNVTGEVLPCNHNHGAGGLPGLLEVVLGGGRRPAPEGPEKVDPSKMN